MNVEFDPLKDEANREKHGLSLSQAASIFEFFRIDVEDDREDYGETRYVTLGRIDRRRIVVCVWTLRDERARIISLRKADKDEREIYNLHRP